jgi:hypothetical protein
MKSFTIILFLFLTVGIAAAPTAAQNNVPPEVREMARKVMMPVVYTVPGMDKVKVLQNLKYTKIDDHYEKETRFSRICRGGGIQLGGRTVEFRCFENKPSTNSQGTRWATRF